MPELPVEAVTADDVKTQRLWYTLCARCGALDDWSDNAADARFNRKAHLDWHKKQDAEKGASNRA